MASKLSWGLISTAHINQVIIPAIRNEPRCELLGVASRDPKRAKAYAAQWAIPRAYGSYEALLADPEIDVVYISLPNSLHCAWSITAAQAGKHILCEKPLALSVEDCDRMISSAASNHVVLQEALMYRYHPQASRIQSILKERTLGSIQYVYAVLSFQLDAIYPETLADGSNVRLNPDLGGGCLWDIGYYTINFSRMVMGCEPIRVWGSMTKYHGTQVDSAFCGTLIFPAGAIAQIQCGYQQPLRSHAEIVGDNGTLRLPYAYGLLWDKPEPLELEAGERKESFSIEPANPYQCEIVHLCDRILEGKSPHVPLEDARNSIAVVQALYHSARAGTQINRKDVIGSQG